MTSTEAPRKRRKGDFGHFKEKECEIQNGNSSIDRLLLQKVIDEWSDGLLLLELEKIEQREVIFHVVSSNSAFANFFPAVNQKEFKFPLSSLGERSGDTPLLTDDSVNPSLSFWMDVFNSTISSKMEGKFFWKESSSIQVTFSSHTLLSRTFVNVTFRKLLLEPKIDEKIVEEEPKKANENCRFSCMTETEWLELSQVKMGFTSQLVAVDRSEPNDVFSIFANPAYLDFHKPPKNEENDYYNKWMIKDWGFTEANVFRRIILQAEGYDTTPFETRRWMAARGCDTSNMRFIRGRVWHLNYVKEQTNPIEFFLVTMEDETEVHRKENVTVGQNITLRNFFDSTPLLMAVIEIISDDNALYQQLNAKFARQLLKGREQIYPRNEDVDLMSDKECVEKTMGKSMREFGMAAERSRHYIEKIKQAKGKSSLTHEEFDTVVKRTYSNFIKHMADNTYLCISSDVTETRAMESDIRNQKEILEFTVKERTQELEEALAVKSRFLATMSHEIRTPLAGIMGGLTFLSETQQLSAEARELLRIGQICSQQLLLVINDVLDLSKIEANQVTFDQRPLRFKGIVEECVEVSSIESSRKNIPIILHSDLPHNLVLNVDGGRVRQIVLNLLSNAVKFTHLGEILISIKVCEDPQENSKMEITEENSEYKTIQVSVKDTGIGISEEFKTRIFSPFSQSDSSITRKYGGSGLGLSISKRLVEMMGGRMWVESGLEKGSTFSFTIRAKTSLNGNPQEDLNQKVLQEIRNDLRAINRESKKRVAVIESNGILRSELMKKFELLDFETRVFSSIDEFLSAKVQQPDMILFSNKESIQDIKACIQRFDMNCKVVVASSGVVPGGSQDITLSMNSQNRSLDSLQILDNLPGTLTLRKPVHTQRFLLLLDEIFNRGIRTEEFETIRHLLTETKKECKSVEGLKVLVAEDNVMNQKIIVRMLKTMGIEAKMVDNGKKVIQALEENDYDLILMDCMMPIMGGIEATKHIRTHFPKEKQPKIFALTADVFTENKLMCLSVGMDEVLNKPIHQNDLKEALAKAF